MGALPSISPAERSDSEANLLAVSEAKRLFKTSIGGKPFRVKEKTRFRYVMYRAPADTKLLDVVLKLLLRHPEYIDAFVAYFSNFAQRRRIARAAIEFLRTGLPYSYVRGELWHVIARTAGKAEFSEALPLARIDARTRSDCTALSWGVMHFLIRCQNLGIAKIGTRLASEKSLSKALLVPIFLDKFLMHSTGLKQLLRGTLEEQLAACREMQKREITLAALGLRQRDVTDLCRNSLRALGVIKKRSNIQSDWIAESVTQLYGCHDIKIWRLLLGSEYEHAWQLLVLEQA